MEQIGEYLVRHLVGEGGMGRVYEAEERLSKRRVALKVLREELSQSERARALFLNEMQILAHLEHPNIVRSLASIEDKGKLVIVLEYLEGQTLRLRLAERGRLPWDEAAHVVMCIAQALEAAHGQEPPVIHRDLKPENIMLLDDGTVKVMDFGIAKLIQELDQTNTRNVGTLQYMSPEQIDAHSIDQRSDLYCLGLIFYELLTGAPPFQETSPRLLLNKQCTERPPDLPDEVQLSAGLEKLLFELLEKAPAARPQSAQAVIETLEMFLPSRSRFGAGTSSDRTRSSRRRGSATKPAAGLDSGSAEAAPPAADAAPTPAPEARAAAGADSLADEAGAAPPPEGHPEPAATAGSREASTEPGGGGGHEPTELSTSVSILIILFLTVVAGLATYAYRTGALSGDETESEAESSPPAAATGTPAPSK